MWYNNKTKELQNNPPYSDFLREDLIQELYPYWAEVEDTFVPEKDLNTQVAEIEAKYQSRLTAINDRLFAIVLSGGDVQPLKTEYGTVLADRETEILNLLGGM